MMAPATDLTKVLFFSGLVVVGLALKALDGRLGGGGPSCANSAIQDTVMRIIKDTRFGSLTIDASASPKLRNVTLDDYRSDLQLVSCSATIDHALVTDENAAVPWHASQRRTVIVAFTVQPA
jgi:hypothetical protein